MRLMTEIETETNLMTVNEMKMTTEIVDMIV